jgi:hypothetical protein
MVALNVWGPRGPTLESYRGKVRKGACVTNAPSEYDGAELYER